MSDDLLFEQELLEESLQNEALEWWRRGHTVQQQGRLKEAIECYDRSIEIFPTAEAYTFRGWAKSFQGKLSEAIADCHKAISVDPDYGNPYNDIGAYLIQLGDLRGAIPWLKRAFTAKRYECPFYPRHNLGRVYEQLGDFPRALHYYKSAYLLNKNYTIAIEAFRRLQGKLN